MTVAKRKPRTVESLNLLWGAAIALTLFSVSFFLSWAEFRALYDSDRIYFAVSTGLALVTFALFCAYVIATHTEIILLNQYLGEEAIPRVKPKVYLITFGLAILFGALIALSRNLLTYSAVMVGYNLFDLWGNWEVARQIGPPIEKKLQSRLDGEAKHGLLTLRDFYFRNPTIPRVVTIMFVNWIVVCLALSHYFTNDTSFRNLGYGLLLANIVVGEAVIHFWRWRSIYRL